ncbi:HET-domain-containing protein [Poronia punctata]|nr:HET-domain-containing protein [Poronia punctata]
MRLIDVNTLQLIEFFTNIPPYAILSHTWGSEEVTFQDYLFAVNPTHHSHSHHHSSHHQAQAQEIKTIRTKTGFHKILNSCSRAKRDGISYLWCDTNCIDKRSSAELSEAINSMYAWYRDSVICYAYLADYTHNPKNSTVPDGSFDQSRWFTRGWTLQELLAPSKVVFYDSKWMDLGDRAVLAERISRVTRIHIGALKDRDTVPEYSIAQRMSWAADRQTTRPEDIAYSLLGIFKVNMSLLYGEGSTAFRRLQQKIMKVSDDHSILAWDASMEEKTHWMGALALSPASFRSCGSIVRARDLYRNPFSVTNLGISIKLEVMELLQQNACIAGLNCVQELRNYPNEATAINRKGHSRHFQVWITLLHFGARQSVRVHQPSSRIALEQSYSFRGKPKAKDLFISMNPGADGFCVELKQNILEHPFGQHPRILPSGLFVVISSGTLSSSGMTFDKVYPLSNLQLMPLKGREISSISHDLVSYGSFAALLSVAWDERSRPVKWSSTVILYQDLQCLMQISSQSAWSCLFGRKPHSAGGSCCNTITKMQELHGLLEHKYGISEQQPSNLGMSPKIHFEAGYYDAFGRPYLITHIILREQVRNAWVRET